MADLTFRLRLTGTRQLGAQFRRVQAQVGQSTQRINQQLSGMGARANAVFGRMRGAAQMLGGVLERFGGMVIGAMGGALRAMRNFALAGAAVFTGVVVASITRANEFSEAFGRLRAATGRSRGELAALSEQALELGRNTSFTAVQVLALQETLGRAGFSTGDISTLTPTVLNVARASDVSTDVAADAVGTNLRTFGEDSSQAGRFGDAMVRATTLANTTFEGIQQGLIDSAPVFASVGASLEDAVATSAALADAGFRGSRGGVAARNIVSRLAAPTARQARRQQRTLRTQGVDLDRESFFSGEGDDRRFDMGATVAALREATADLSDEARLSVVKSLVGDEAAGSLVALMNQAPERFTELRDSIGNAGGAAEDAARAMEDNLGGDMRRMKSAVEGFAIALGSSLQPVMRRLIPQIGALVTKLTEWTNANPQAVNKLGTLITAMVEFGKELTIFTVRIGRLVEDYILPALRLLPGFALVEATGDALSAGGGEEGASEAQRINARAMEIIANRMREAGGDASAINAAGTQQALDAAVAQASAERFTERLGEASGDGTATRDNTTATERATRAMERLAASNERLAASGGAGGGDTGGDVGAE